MVVLEIFDKSGNALADLSSLATTRTISKQRNTYDVINLSFDLDAITKFCTSISTSWDVLFSVMQNSVRITDGSYVISAGIIAYAQPQINGDSRTLTLIAYGWAFLLTKRYTADTVTYTGTDAGQIAWSLINTSQGLTNGDIGITSGTIQTSVNRDRTYSYKRIFDAIVELSQVINGFDFEVTWDKKFNVYYPKIGSNPSGVSFNYPGNIISIAFTRDGQKIVNESIVVGSGSGVNAIRATSDDTVSAQKYYLLQSVDLQSDVSVQATAQQKADGNVLNLKSFIDVPDITVNGSENPILGTYGIGDIVPINCEHPAFSNVNGYFKIDAIDISIDENDYKEVRLRLTP